MAISKGKGWADVEVRGVCLQVHVLISTEYVELSEREEFCDAHGDYHILVGFDVDQVLVVDDTGEQRDRVAGDPTDAEIIAALAASEDSWFYGNLDEWEAVS